MAQLQHLQRFAFTLLSVTQLWEEQRINALFAANFFKSVAYHPDESQLLTCGTDRKITYWDVLNMNAIRIIDGSESADVNSLHVNSDGRFFVSGGGAKPSSGGRSSCSPCANLHGRPRAVMGQCVPPDASQCLQSRVR